MLEDCRLNNYKRYMNLIKNPWAIYFIISEARTNGKIMHAIISCNSNATESEDARMQDCFYI